MMLYEEGASDWNMKCSAICRNFATRRSSTAATRKTSPNGRQTGPCKFETCSPTHPGLTYDFLVQHPVDKMYRGPSCAALGSEDMSLEEFVNRLAEHPLVFSPGQKGITASQPTCATLVEVLSGQSLALSLSRASSIRCVCRIPSSRCPKTKPTGSPHATSATRKRKKSACKTPAPQAHISLSGFSNQAGRPGIVFGRLSPVLPHAAEWWRTGRRPHSKSHHHRLYGSEPFAEGARPWRKWAMRRSAKRAWMGQVLAWVFSGHKRGGRHGAGHRRNVFLGRGRQHLFLDRPGGRTDRNLDDATHAVGRLPPQTSISAAYLRGNHRVTTI